MVARERGSGDYWAIQCKFYDPTHTLQKADIDSFFTASGKCFETAEGERSFSQRLIVATTDKWSKHAEQALEHQTIPATRLWLKDLAASPVDWSQFSLAKIEDMRLTEQLTRANARVLFLTPSIALVSQALREWTAQATQPIQVFAICSDTKVGRNAEDIRTHDLAYPATTDATKLVAAVNALPEDRRTLVFSTYQSIQVVADAQQQGFGAFDLIICDEAHRTAGLTLPSEDPSAFVKVHHNHIVAGRKRLYMTATPRIYADTSKTKASEVNAALFSMDDAETFGHEFYRLGFGKAVEQDLLSEYKVLIVAVKESEMAKLANNFNNAYKIDDKQAIDIRFATKIVGSWKGLSKRGLAVVGEDGQEEAAYSEDTSPMRRALAFSKSIKGSKQTKESFAKLVTLYPQAHDLPDGMVDCSLQHVDGTMNALARQEALDWLKDDLDTGKCRILSNARCLSEGIDVPALDAVVFFDTRESIVDIVQAVGRVMRKSEGKQYGYIILPVCIPSGKVKDYNRYIDSDPQFKGIWKVIKALRAHDESLVDEAEFRRKIKVIGDPGGPDSTGGGGKGEQATLPLDFPQLPLEAINEAVYAVTPKKLGDREYWSEWAESIGQVAERLTARIEALIDSNQLLAADFTHFLKGLQDTLNPAVSRDDVVEMLAQHILTLPVFQALFADTGFLDSNAVGKAMQDIVDRLDTAAVNSETEGLTAFYENVRERIGLAKSDKSKQDIIRNLYDTFFHSAFPRMAKRLGIVYTPIQVVDFILESADTALRQHFGQHLASRNVQILDPFAGTGTFLVRLIQSGLIEAEALRHKFDYELYANELVLLAYYIASVNIETAYHAATGEYRSFGGMVLTDTFQMTEEGDLVDQAVLPENSARAKRQLNNPIQVIIGNPPYSAGQRSQNDNSKNLSYPTLDERIRATYTAQSGAKLIKNLYDSYVRAIRWASDCIEDRGVVAFVTNGSFLDANSMDGLRKCLVKEYSQLYIFNLRGNARTQGEERHKEGGSVFGSGSRTPVAISIMVKDPAHTGPCELRYYDIGDYLNREDKLGRLEAVGDIGGIDWQTITPNAEGDWINQRDPVFDTFIPLSDEGKGSQAVFAIYSLGVATNRDAWVYNMNRDSLAENMRRMIDAFNENSRRYAELCDGKNKASCPKLEDVIDADPKRISWTRALKADAKLGKRFVLDETALTTSMYRPYTKQCFYFNRQFNEMVCQIPKLFPTPRHRNVVISVTGRGASKSFSALVADVIPNLHLHDTGQCFPLYWYEKLEGKAKPQDEMFAAEATPDADSYIRHDAITDWALEAFRKHYGNDGITREDIFWYVYGILHSPEYKMRFAANLKKMLPRIPYAKDFRAFRDAGRELGDWHLNYETVDPYPLTEGDKRLVMEDDDYRVVKMSFGKGGRNPDKTVIAYNHHLILRDIPLEAYDYIVNGKPAIEWIMDRYQVTTEKNSGIGNDPNAWSEDPRYIVDLVKRIVTVSVESVRIIKSLPPLNAAVA